MYNINHNTLLLRHNCFIC